MSGKVLVCFVFLGDKVENVMCVWEILVGSLTSSSQASLSWNLRVLFKVNYMQLHVMLSSIFLSALRWLCLILLGNEHICFACCIRPLHIAIWKYAGNIYIFLYSRQKETLRKQKVHVFHVSMSDRNVFENRYTYTYTCTYTYTYTFTYNAHAVSYRPRMKLSL